jgi:feruloyl-CoA synthase
MFARTQPAANSTNMGVLVPGSDVKLVPTEGKLEARVKGPNITPGYWRQPELTAKAFDEEGFYKLGDAFKFDDPSDPSKGLLFDGRVAEDFKLATGTWVSVGPLRAKLIDALAPYVRDVVIAGADRDDIRILVFPNIDACRQLSGLPQDADLDTVLTHDNVRQTLQNALSDLAKKSTGSSNRVCRALLMSEQPSLDAGEMTDKGSINQRAVLTRRAKLVQELYAPTSAPHIIDVTAGQ